MINFLWESRDSRFI